MSLHYGNPHRTPSQSSHSSHYHSQRPPSTQYGAPPPQQGYYGHSQQPPYGRPPPSVGPPPGADPQLWQWFSAVDTDRSGAISVTELQSALVNGACPSPLPRGPARRSLRGRSSLIARPRSQETGRVSLPRFRCGVARPRVCVGPGRDELPRARLRARVRSRVPGGTAHTLEIDGPRSVEFDLDTVKMLMSIFVSALCFSDRTVAVKIANAVLRNNRTRIAAEPSASMASFSAA